MKSVVGSKVESGRVLGEGWVAIAAAVAIIVGWSVPAQAQIKLVFEQGLGGYTGAADTCFFTGDPERVTGNAGSWEWDTSSDAGISFGLIRFDGIVGTGPGQIPPNTTLISAILSLAVTGSGSASEIATFHELRIPFNDQSDMIEFNEGYELFPGEEYEEEIIVEIPGPSSGDVLQIDVTSAIQKAVNGGDYFGWVVVPGGSDGVDVASSEAGSNRPRLTVIIEGNAPEATRSLTPQIYFLAGETINVSIDVSLPSGTMDVEIVETISAGWTASNISNGGTFAAGTITWNLVGFSGSTTLTYAAEVPAGADTEAFFSGTANDQYFVFGDNTAVFSPPFSPIGPVDVNPGDVVIIQIENATPITDQRNYRLEGDSSLKSGLFLRSLIDGRVSPLRDEDEVQITINITQAGNYYLFANCASDSGESDSFFPGIDGDVDNDDWYRFNLDPDDGQFHVQWVTSEGLGNEVVEYPIEAGEHVINWHVREPDARVDWVGITDNWELDLSTVVEPEPVSVEEWSVH